MGDAVPVRSERRQQQFYDQVSNVAGAPQIEVRRSTSRNQYILRKMLPQFSTRAWDFSRPAS
jgi:hypothetical protein